MVCGVWCVVCGVWCAVCGVRFVVYGAWCSAWGEAALPHFFGPRIITCSPHRSNSTSRHVTSRNVTLRRTTPHHTTPRRRPRHRRRRRRGSAVLRHDATKSRHRRGGMVALRTVGGAGARGAQDACMLMHAHACTVFMKPAREVSFPAYPSAVPAAPVPATPRPSTYPSETPLGATGV